MLLYNLQPLNQFDVSWRWCCSYNTKQFWMSDAILCVSVYLCMLLLKKRHAKEQWYRLHKAVWLSMAEHSTQSCFTGNLSASLVEVTHQYTPLIQDIHDTVSWYHWCHMIICVINVHCTYVDIQLFHILPRWTMYVCTSFMPKAPCMLRYDLKAPFS